MTTDRDTIRELREPDEKTTALKEAISAAMGERLGGNILPSQEYAVLFTLLHVADKLDLADENAALREALQKLRNVTNVLQLYIASTDPDFCRISILSAIREADRLLETKAEPEAIEKALTSPPSDHINDSTKLVERPAAQEPERSKLCCGEAAVGCDFPYALGASARKAGCDAGN